MPEDLMDRFKEWTEQNPLRRFRTKRSITIFNAAGILGVSITTIQMWENGNNHPTESNMSKIAALTGNETIAQEWTEWSQSRPQIGAGA